MPKSFLQKKEPDRSTSPYLSMTSQSRNDQYGGGMLSRLQCSLNILFKQIEKHKIESELIIVDYNPPKDSKLLKDALVFPANSEYLSIRVIEVPSKIHSRYLYSDNNPINISVAANVGLARSRGQFSVYRASDIIWSEELLSIIAKKQLDHNTKIRCSRCDISSEILNHPDLTLEEAYEFCRTHITKKMIKLKYYVKDLPDLLLGADGDFQLMSTFDTKQLRGFWEQKVVHYNDGYREFCAYAAGIKDKLLTDINIYKIEHEGMYNSRMLASIIPFYNKIKRIIPDNLFGPTVIKYARMTGLTKILYDWRVITIPGNPHPQPSRNEYYKICKKIVNREIDYVLNSPDWGLSNENLKEYTMLRAAWDQ